MAKTIEDAVGEAVLKELLKSVNVDGLVAKHMPDIDKMIKRCVEVATKSFEDSYIENIADCMYDGNFSKATDALDKFIETSVIERLNPPKKKKTVKKSKKARK